MGVKKTRFLYLIDNDPGYLYSDDVIIYVAESRGLLLLPSRKIEGTLPLTKELAIASFPLRLGKDPSSGILYGERLSSGRHRSKGKYSSTEANGPLST